jgi:hypothetical protein
MQKSLKSFHIRALNVAQIILKRRILAIDGAGVADEPCTAPAPATELKASPTSLPTLRRLSADHGTTWIMPEGHPRPTEPTRQPQPRHGPSRTTTKPPHPQHQRKTLLMSTGRKANFLITRDSKGGSPGTARELVRTQNYADLNADLPYLIQASDTVKIPDNAILLMIGNTAELEAALAAASDNGILRIAPADPEKVSFVCRYVRMKISLTQNDTLIAIASTAYWNALGQALSPEWQPMGRQNADSVSLYSHPADPGNIDVQGTTNLPYMVRWIKDNDEVPTVDKIGRRL